MSQPCSVILDIVASTAGGWSPNCINCLHNTCCFLILTHSLSKTPLSVSWWHTTHGPCSVSARAIHFFLLKVIFPFSPLSLHRLSPGNYMLMFPDPDQFSSPLQNLCGAGPPTSLQGRHELPQHPEQTSLRQFFRCMHTRATLKSRARRCFPSAISIATYLHCSVA